SAATESRIEFQRARYHRRRNDATGTVPDHNKLIGVIELGDRNQAPCTDIDDPIEPGRSATSKPPQDHPTTGNLDRSPPVGNGLQCKKRCERGKQGCDDAERCGQTEMVCDDVRNQYTARNCELQPG